MACRLTPGSAHPCMSPRGRLGASFPCLADPANGLALSTLSTNGDKRGQGQCLPGFYRAVSPAFVVLCSRFGRERGRSPIRRSRRHQRRPRQGAAPSRAMDPCPATKNYVVGAQVWGVESSLGRTSHFQVPGRSPISTPVCLKTASISLPLVRGWSARNLQHAAASSSRSPSLFWRPRLIIVVLLIERRGKRTQPHCALPRPLSSITPL